MSTQVQNLDPSSSSIWKDKFYQVQHEYEAKVKLWSQEESGLYKSILRLIFTHTGLDKELDRKLSSMRNQLRENHSSKARNNIIDPVIEEVVSHARQRKNRNTATNGTAAPLDTLCKKLVLPLKYQGQLTTIRQSLAKRTDKKALHACIDQLSSLLNRVSNTNKAEPERIELKTDDPLMLLLENLSLPGEIGLEIISLRKRAGEIEEEQERIQLIQELVQVLSRRQQHGQGSEANAENFPHLKDTLLELFEWLSIPDDYRAKVEELKTRIVGLEAEPDLSAVLHDTAIIMNDLQTSLQIELEDVQSFLGTITSRLGEVESWFHDFTREEAQSRNETQQLNDNISNNVRDIRAGITAGKDLREIKQNIENRLKFIEQSVEHFFQSAQKRRQFWEKKVSSLRQRIDSMKGETVKLHKRVQAEQRKAKTDALTGIPNRLAYNEKFREEFARWQRHAQAFSICIIDVDKFKAVNDTYGHKAGDKVLKTIAEVCMAKIRKMDFIARYGGEEFVLLLPATFLDKACIVAENLRREIETCKFHYAGKPVAVTVSCGLAQLRQGDTSESVFARADRALYAAKDQGRNQVVSEK